MIEHELVSETTFLESYEITSELLMESVAELLEKVSVEELSQFQIDKLVDRYNLLTKSLVNQVARMRIGEEVD